MTAAAEPGRARGWSADATEDAEPPARPARPLAVEVAAAILVGAGGFRLVAITLAILNPNPPFPLEPVVVVLETALQVLTIVTGILIRTGRAWLVAVNLAAVLAFVEILSLPSVVSLLFAVLFGFAFGATFVNKPWFDGMTAWRGGAEARRV